MPRWEDIQPGIGATAALRKPNLLACLIKDTRHYRSTFGLKRHLNTQSLQLYRLQAQRLQGKRSRHVTSAILLFLLL